MRRLLYIIFTIGILFFSSCKKDTSITNVNVTIGGLLSLTGNWSSLGVNSQEAMNIAVADINNFMQQTGSKYRFSTAIYDTKLDTGLALTSIQDGLKNNIHYMIGPQSSAEAKAVLSYANSNNILLVSQGSTASSIAIPGDALFRFCPGDSVEGEAMANTIFSSGKSLIITLSRNDAGNLGLQESVGKTFSSLGGDVKAMAAYADTTTDFSALLATLQTELQNDTLALGANKVGIYLASFDECTKLFSQAASNPLFRSVNWYGGDGAVLNNALISDTLASSFANETHFFAPNFGLPQVSNPKLAAISNAIQNKTGIAPDAYALAAYDAMWVIAKTVAGLPNAQPDFSTVKSVFMSEADQYYGITGAMQLNAAGDRSTGSFDYWGVVSINLKYQWKLVGKSN